jgi:hypothetical protein
LQVQQTGVQQAARSALVLGRAARERVDVALANGVAG